MTQSGGNGNKSDVNSSDMETYEPVYAPGDDTEPIGWWKTEPDEEEGELIPDLPPELDDQDPPTSN